MKVRITHLSAHQNAKVLAVLMAVFSLIIVIPMLVVFYFAPTVDQHGNTSAASIPLAIAVAVKDGRVKKGDLVLLEAMGGGFTWGSALLRW